MFRVVACLTEHHNIGLVLLAVCVCIAACASAAFVLYSIAEFAVEARQKWRCLAGTLIGGGAWATHFVAMLAFNPGFPIEFDILSTFISALVGVLLAWTALEFMSKLQPGRVILPGLLLAGAVVGLHYIGMNGVILPAQKIWRTDLVIASWFAAVAFAIPALFVLQRYRSTLGQALGAALLIAMVLSLHFTGMGALVLVPDPRINIAAHALDRGALAAVVTAAALAVLSAGVILSFAQQRIMQNTRAMALHDALTGLPNQRRLETLFERSLAAMKPEDRLAIASIDLDGFAEFNKTHGRARGDEVLVQLSAILKAEGGQAAIVARSGGDEFVLVAPLAAGEDLIRRIAALVDHIAAAESIPSISASIGVAIAPDDGTDLEALLRRSEIALSRAQEEGRARFAFFAAGIDAQMLERVSLDNDVRAAVSSGDIEPYFQPLVDLSNGAVVGFEILARWRHPKRGDVPPSTFIARVEQLGLMAEFTFALLARACRAAQSWPTPLPIALNVSAEQLRDPFLPQSLLRTAMEAGLPPQRLKIEITEDALVQDMELARSILVSMKRLGMRIALDDFGTGYSSLRHVRELPFDTLKIDQSFVREMLSCEEHRTLVRTIIQMSQNLGLQTIAEGIESREIADELRNLGCDFGQGYYFGRAMSAEDVVAALDAVGSRPDVHMVASRAKS